jgi:hypothetical protein
LMRVAVLKTRQINFLWWYKCMIVVYT